MTVEPARPGLAWNGKLPCRACRDSRGLLRALRQREVRAVRDLKGKSVAVKDLGGGDHILLSSLLAYVGHGSRNDIPWVGKRKGDAMRYFSTERRTPSWRFLRNRRNCARRRSGMSSSTPRRTSPGSSTSAACCCQPRFVARTPSPPSVRCARFSRPPTFVRGAGAGRP